MASALDKHVLSDATVRDHVDFQLNFVGYFNDWSTDNITACQTSSRWSECLVNAYHLCAQHVAGAGAEHGNWWSYSKCMYSNQYEDGSAAGPGLECAGLNPHPNQTCTATKYPAIVEGYSKVCADESGISPEDVAVCVTSGMGVTLLKASNHKTVTFPRNPNGYIEPQWVQVNGPDCERVGYPGASGCGGSIDNTSCLTWENCDADSWALHIRSRVCADGLCDSSPSRSALALPAST